MSNAEFYRSTVFLPKTDFAMRAGLPEKEPEIIAKWQAMDLYGQLRKRAQGRPVFTLHDGPPYANGNIHIGHAVNKILKDVVVKSYQMLGYDAPYVPGWDCHGLPIEWKIEEKYRETGQNKDAVDVLSFRDECRKFAQSWVDIQSQEFQRLGVTGDWKNPYLTMTLEAEATIVREIHKFVLNGGLYKGVKPVMWSVVEKTALAEAEVEYKEHKSITIWVRFPVLNTNVPALKNSDVVIWTTTPWTMPSNRAVAFGHDIDYALFTVTEIEDGAKAKVGDHIILATSLADSVKAQAKIAQWTQSESFKGAALSGTILTHPLRGKGYDFDVPMLAGDFVTQDTGTGFVHIAPGHGADDFYLGQAHGIEVTDNVDDGGVMRPHVPLFAGKTVYTDKGEMGDASPAVLRELDAAGKLLAKGSLKHEYPHSWRSKAPLIFRTTPQWFISMDTNDLRQSALKAIGETKWFPAMGENRIRAMIEQRPDWCISRQRAWGVPIAIFLDKKNGAVLKDPTVLKRIGDIFEAEGSDSWFKRPAQDFLGSDYKSENYQQIFDIVDVWFESGTTHAFVLENRPDLSSPADLYLEGSDQHRGWFHSSLLESCGTRGHAPYKAVLTHGFVLDEKGYKMSKSLGNVIAPQDIMKELGADILRLWTVTSDYSDDIRIGKNLLDTVSDMYRRIRNTLRYILGALEGFTPSEKITADEYKTLPELDRLMLHEISILDDQIRSAIKAYDFMDMVQKIHHFCAITLSAFYFDIRKDRLYCDRPDLFERRGYRTVMLHLFEALTAWLAPILAFTTEEAWKERPQDFFEEESIHLRHFADVPLDWRDDNLAKKWDVVRAVRKVVTGALEPKRADKTIGSSLEAHPQIFVTSDIAKILEGINLAEVCITSQATLLIGDGPDNGFKLNDVPGVRVVFGKAEGKKCERSWRILPEVGHDKDYPDLSRRDADAVRYFLTRKKAA